MKFMKGVSNELNPNYKCKKAMSPYIAFVKSERPKLNREQPGLTFSESMKALGDKWKQMSEHEKKPYHDIA